MTTTTEESRTQVADRLTRPYRTWFLDARPDPATIATPDEVYAAVLRNVSQRRQRGVYRFTRKRPPIDDTHGRLWRTLYDHARPGGEYRSVGDLLLIRMQVGAATYDRFDAAVDKQAALARAGRR